MTLENQIENIPGNLMTAYKAAVPSTLLHVDQLMNERRTNPVTPQGDHLRDQWIYTADGELYFVKGTTPMLAMTREVDNLVLRHIDDAFAQLTADRNYRPDRVEAERSIQAKDTQIFDLTKLKLNKQNAEFSYMEVSTTKYDKLNPEQRRLAERVYGTRADFVANMKMLTEAGIQTTRVCVLNPDYVKEYAQGWPIGCASWLSDFSDDARFRAIGHGIDLVSHVRGVRRDVVEQNSKG